MIVVKLQGGLGNQLFQYAIGKRLALHHNTPFKLDTTFLNQTEATGKITPRSYELDQLSTTDETASAADIHAFSNSANLLHRLKKYFTRSKYIREKSFRFDPDFLSYGNNCYLDGYWQCENYFIEISDVLRNEFKCKLAPDEKNIEMQANIASTNAVSIHIRRGDYISNPAAHQFHGICSLEYYQQAVDLIAAKTSNPHFFIFSDDVNWVAANFTINFPTIIVDINDSSSGAKDMQLMSCCKHHIIANSSFSWWGAWLNTDQQKIVVAPKNWFRDSSIDTSTILPASWHTI
ncbi:MAG: alpha-1,2-fucosyltransferase [Chitinophagaceae bacterium]|nr:alpha-1,2-fucosyltransferase [Chitinophagaceae bacterium]